LTAQKRLDRLIQVVKELNREGGRFNLVLIGDGPERKTLETLAADAKDYVFFAGPRYEEEEIAKFIANADLCVSPGEVGLTALHCLSYGTPVCTHGNMAEQMPEVESVAHGRTGVLFPQSDNGLRDGIEYWFESPRDREAVRRLCYEVIDQKFNPQNQLRIFRNIFKRLAAG
jgi:glycosyltransferase involved in cell wall biosynthesis